MTQFIHRWLPTNAHKGRSTDNKIPHCPHCQTDEETNEHFLNCPRDTTLWQEAITAIFEKHSTTESQELCSLLCNAVTTPSKNTNKPPDDLSLNLYPLYHAQTQIGWNQVLQGRWTHDIVSHYDSLTNSDQGLRWARSLLQELWDAAHDKWKRRCNAAHNTDENNTDTASQEVNNQIDKIYEVQDRIDAVDRKILHRTAEDIKKMPLKKKRAWLRRTQPHITDSLQRAARRQQTNTRPITHYFTINPLPALTIRPLLPPQSCQADFDPP